MAGPPLAPAKVHYPLSLQDVPGASVTAVAARDKTRADAYAEAHGVPNAYDSYQALCEDPDVDIVYIASKTWAHYRDLMTAIAAGKHVLCEKPLFIHLSSLFGGVSEEWRQSARFHVPSTSSAPLHGRRA